MEIFPEIGPLKFFCLPKFGARSPPMLISVSAYHLSPSSSSPHIAQPPVFKYTLRLILEDALLLFHLRFVLFPPFLSSSFFSSTSSYSSASPSSQSSSFYSFSCRGRPKPIYAHSAVAVTRPKLKFRLRP